MLNEAHAKKLNISCEIFTNVKASRDKSPPLFITLYRIRKVSKPWHFDFTPDLKNCDNVNISAERASKIERNPVLPVVPSIQYFTPTSLSTSANFFFRERSEVFTMLEFASCIWIYSHVWKKSAFAKTLVWLMLTAVCQLRILSCR